MGSNSKQLSITNSVGSSTCEDKTQEEPGCSVFTAEILPVILDNLKILTSTDVLNFRLVNRCWRDAATNVLLNRNACDIVLDIGQVPYVYGGDVNIHYHAQLLNVDRENWNDPPIFKFYNARPPHSLFPDLIQCISASPKFPSNSIKFLGGCEKVLNNLGLSPADVNHHFEEDDHLLKFFSLYGKEIQKLSFPSEISRSAVQNLLFVHLPYLTCLDLRNFELFPSHVQEDTHIFSLPSSQEFKDRVIPSLKIETIHLESDPMFYLCKAHLLEEVVNSSPNLRAVQDVGLAGLSFLMKMEKAHLTKCLNFDPSENLKFVDSLAELFCHEDTFSTLKLTALTVKLSNVSADEGKVTGILNEILKGSQDTLKYLEIHVNPEDVLPNILIPPLEKLQCLKLVKQVSEFLPFGLPSAEPYENEERPGAAAGIINIHVSRTLYDRHVFEFENQENPNRIPPKYFPALSKVTLDLGLGLGAVDRLDTYKNKLLAFFEIEQCGMDVSGDVLPSVTTLEMTSFPDAGMALGKLFPNVRHLKIKCDPLTKLHNWVWDTFPKLERFHICDFTASLKAEAIDSFFTGLHQKLCTKFADKNVAATGLEFSPEQINFLRTEPYIGDSANLKEFMIHFKDRISKMFVSQLTGLHGFREIVERSKIIFSFDAVKLNEQDRKDIQKHLEPVAPYIEVRQ